MTTTPPRVLGVDLALGTTGIADSGRLSAPHTYTITAWGLDGLSRIRAIVGKIRLATRDIDLVVLEGPAYGAAKGQAGHHERAGLWWSVVDMLDRSDIPVAVCPPACRAKYATGRGNAGKDDVIRELARAFPWFEGGNDEADALALMAAGRDHLGAPLAQMPEANRKALTGIDWPDIVLAVGA